MSGAHHESATPSSANFSRTACARVQRVRQRRAPGVMQVQRYLFERQDLRDLAHDLFSVSRGPNANRIAQ